MVDEQLDVGVFRKGPFERATLNHFGEGTDFIGHVRQAGIASESQHFVAHSGILKLPSSRWSAPRCSSSAETSDSKRSSSRSTARIWSPIRSRRGASACHAASYRS